MAQPYLSQIEAFPFNFAPKGWALCAGQLIPINQNQALFALLGTTFGGDGRTNFALPDLRGRLANGFGQGSGLANYTPRPARRGGDAHSHRDGNADAQSLGQRREKRDDRRDEHAGQRGHLRRRLFE